MGTEAAWVPYVAAAMSATGAGVQAVEAHDTAKEKDQIAAQGVREQAAKREEANQRVNDEIDALRTSTSAEGEQEASDAFMTQLNATNTQAQGQKAVGNVSEAYESDSAQASKDVTESGQKKAKTMSKISGAKRQRQDEAVSANRLAGDLGLIANAAEGEAFLNQLKQSSARDNEWVNAAGSLLSAGGGALSAGAGTTASGLQDTTVDNLAGGSFTNYAPRGW